MNKTFNLTLDIPDNVRSLKLTDVVKWLDSDNRVNRVGKFSTMQMTNILNNIFTRIGLELDNEQFIFLLDDSNRLLCEASAGSGKTTISQLKMIKYKLLYGMSGNNILTIAYNDHASKDMEIKHKYLVEQIMAQRIQGVSIDNSIVCRTFHSNALAWVITYAEKLGMKGVRTDFTDMKSILRKTKSIVISDSDAKSYMRRALLGSLKKLQPDYDIDSIRGSLLEDIVSYLGYIEECMMSVHDTVNMSKFRELELEENVLEETIYRFNRLCKHNDKYTFSKIVVMFYELLRDNEDVRTRVQNAYRVLLVDEYQDMTPLMNSVLALMINDSTIFNAIGDGDQSIYGFKGTDSLNCINFRNKFNNGKVVSMGANRRCRKVILDTAKDVISINKLRYNKDIYSLKDGGEVILIPYDNVNEEYSKIVNELKSVPIDDLSEICISYRNKESSRLLAKMLLDARIPFTVKSGYSPYEDILSVSLYNILMLLRYPTRRAYQLTMLYKLTPATKKQVESVIGEDTDNGLVHFIDYDWEQLGNISRSIRHCLTVLHECEEAVRSGARMSSFFNKALNLFRMYYWNWVSETNGFSSTLEDSVIESYSCELTFKQFIDNYHEIIEMKDKFEKSGNGVRLTTFHGLKGLEFDKVYLIDMDESIFPNYQKIEIEFENDVDAELNEKEECARLFYVACTRPRDSLVIYYSADNPSCYIDLINRDKSYIGHHIDNSEDIFDIFDDMFENGDLFEFGEVIEDDSLLVEDDESTIEQDKKLVNDFEVIIGQDSNIVLDLTVSSNDSKQVKLAKRRMFMLHESSKTYYIIEEGEELKNDKVDFEMSREISEEEYLIGIKKQKEEESKFFDNIIDSNVSESGDKKLNKTIGILNMLSDEVV